ncbi:hypothetical protein JW977_03660 [Candidatus Falkowbacteria bacterium]|nr:hypothetical protein [Candidatus Falkowbacteria bacterium]
MKVRGFKDKESGGICPKCLRQYYPDAYEILKESDKLTIEQINQAES